ncbi:uncharacterized protein LOC119110341 [Pollicipes pollicipes]|uniref:uncharacterized protein LOC119110341 n=1 Tax=Pollicipes pollicipes TaxID=41117 RepID=UPI001884B70E|nr:uncharacterized protein LOC119110341 [Pollicipes pollicipes]
MKTTRAVQLLLALCAAAALTGALPQRAPRDGATSPAIQWLCQRSDCSCQDRGGLEEVTCDCSSVEEQQPLMLGDATAFVSDRTRVLEVRNCSQVTFVARALSNAISLTELRLTDVDQLVLRERCLHTDRVPHRRISLRRVANLTAEPDAMHLTGEVLELDTVVAERLARAAFGPGSDLIDLRLANSHVEEEAELRLAQAVNVSVVNSTLGALSIEVDEVLDVVVRNSSVGRLETLRLNLRPNFSPEPSRLTIVNNNITSFDSDEVGMIIDEFRLRDNTIGNLTAEMTGSFTTAEVVDNTIGWLGNRVFAAFERRDALDPRGPQTAQPPAKYAFTFGGNRLHAPANGTFGRILSQDNEETVPLYRIYGNQFGCRCEALAELVEVGDRAFLASTNASREDDDDVVTGDAAYRLLYERGTCLGDGRPLSQFRLAAYTSDYACLGERTDERGPGGGADTATAGLLPLLLAAVCAASLAV